MIKRILLDIRFALLFSLCWLVGKLPTWFLYHMLLDAIYFFVYKVGHYRLGIVRANLRRSFPEKSDEDRRHIERRFYRHLAEVFVDTIDMTSISRRELEKRMRFEGLAEHHRQTDGRSWIAALAHYGTWEFFAAYQLHTTAQVVGVYHPITSKVFDKYYRVARSRFGMKPVPMKSILRYMIESRDLGRTINLGLIADQTPPRNAPPKWFKFLSQETAFYTGPEKLALKFGMPVYFVHTWKGGRASYRSRFEMIYDGSEQVTEGEITRRYVEKLEAMIREKPWLWMWSHRRWKHTRRETEKIG